MLSAQTPTPSSTPDDRETRIRALVEQLRPRAEQALRQMAEELVDAADPALFRDTEVRLRDYAHELAAAAQAAGLAGRKKRGTAAPASPARSASAPPASSTT